MSIWEKIKLLWVVKEPAEKLIDGLHGFRTGWKTPGFWVALLGTIISMVAALKGVIPPELSLVATAILTAIYNIGRGFEKMDQNAIRPTLQSTEFWIGILGLVSNAFTQVQTGGVSPAWMTTVQSAIAMIMAAAQQLGARNEKAAS